MANQEHRCGSSKDVPLERDADDLALPGEALEDDDNLRLEVNIDREIWNRWLGWSPCFWIGVLRTRMKSRRIRSDALLSRVQ